MEALALIESLQVHMPEHPGLEKLRRKAQQLKLEREKRAKEKAVQAELELQEPTEGKNVLLRVRFRAGC